MDEVKAKLDIVHQLLNKYVSFTEDVEEEDVNFISGTSFQNQRSGNQGGNMNFYGKVFQKKKKGVSKKNFYGNGQRSNYN